MISVRSEEEENREERRGGCYKERARRKRETCTKDRLYRKRIAYFISTIISKIRKNSEYIFEIVFFSLC